MAKQQKVKQRINIGSIFNEGKYFDFSLLFIVFFLLCIGLVMIYSTSAYKASIDHHGDSAYFLKRQVLFTLAGLIMMYVMSKIDYHIYKKFTLVMIIIMGALLLVVLFFGDETKGAVRWLTIGPFRFQPSEVAKIVIIIYTAHLSTVKVGKLKQLKEMGKVCIGPLILVGLIAKENLSTAIICCATVFAIVFVASPGIKNFLAIGAGGVVAILIFFLTAGYRMERIDVWLNVETHPKGYQTLQALYAIGSGGIWGKGLGQSIQKMGFIPEAHNDMIFSVICEELGLFGAVCIIALFMMLIWRFMLIANNATDLYGALIVVGVMTHIAVQVLVNIAVVTNSIPPTGVTLPFISYGGTSMFVSLVEIGLVLSVARQIKIDKE